jgi:hypothetical protein
MQIPRFARNDMAWRILHRFKGCAGIIVQKTLRCLAESRGKREEVDIPLLCPIPSRKIQFELELGEILSQSLSYFPQILFLALARLGGRVKMQRQTFVPGAVLMLNEDQPFDLMVVDEEPEPPPACPGKLRKVLN